MPKHTYWFTYLLDKLPALKSNARNLHDGFISSLTGHPISPDYRSTEPVLTSALYIVILLVLAIIVRSRFQNLKQSVVPSEKLTLTTAFEVFFGYFYNLSKDIMGTENARRYFPLIGGSAMFIFFSNFMGMIPGVSSPTSSLNVTLGCAFVVFVAFNYYGFKENGISYLTHFFGPVWYLAWLIFPIEIFSTCMRLVTLSIRLMLNIAVDHLLVAIFLGIFAVLVPIPILILGVLVCTIQTLVFCILAAVYIGLATEKHDHGHAGHQEGHKHEGHGQAAHAH